MKVAFLMGNRLNAWHTRMYEPLLEMGVDLKAFTYRPHRYPLDEVRVPYEIIPNRAEQRSLGKKIGEGVVNRILGTPINEEPSDLPNRLEGFDLIQTWELFSVETEAALMAKEMWGTPVLATVWDNIPHHRDEDALYRRRKERARKEADRFLVYTQDSRTMLIDEGVDPERIRKIPPAVDLNAFKPVDQPPKSHTILGVGRMVPEKGFEDLIEAVAILNKTHSVAPVHVRLLGSGPQEDEIDALAEARWLSNYYERTPFLPYSDLPEFLRGGTLLVLGSRPTTQWKEQFGMILIEAMACGVPVVGSTSGAIPEIIGDAGRLYRPGAVDELVEILRELLSSPPLWEQSRQRGIDRCSDLYSHLMNAKDLFNLYNSMLV